jgi:thiol-disulfide isomerase/thioredoxin
MNVWLVASWLGVALAGPEDDVLAVRQCLDNQDVACAEKVVASAGMEKSPLGPVVAWAAEVPFAAGDYPRAYELMQRAVERGYEDRYERLGLYQRALYATAGWVEESSGRFRVRYRPGVDALLVRGALETLELTDRHVTPLLGNPPPGTTITEIFPDGRSFIAASSLTKDDVQSTGVVALSKWTRLLVTSPRALGRGYEWQSTLSHEYIHLVVAHNTHNRAPVWLQEAIAKYLDDRWHDGTDRFKVPLASQGHLADALRDDAFVPFKEITDLGSLAKIKVLNEDGSIDQAASSARASLAYAQLSTLMAYCFSVGGKDVLLRTLPAVRDGIDPREALRRAAGAASFEELEAAWKRYLAGLTLVKRSLDEVPTVLDGGDESDLDPVLSRRKDLANYMRLGDLLYEHGRPRAALVEYDKAFDEEDPNSPMMANRRARALVAVDDDAAAKALLEASVVDYPGFPQTHRVLGEIARAERRLADAKEHYEESVALDPFHLEAQEALLDLYKELGDAERAKRQAEDVEVLRLGGSLLVQKPIHEVHGTYELPRSPEAQAGATNPAMSLQGKPAPPFEVDGLDGRKISLASLKGKVVIVDFWATWCGPCRAIMPHLSKLQATHRSAGLVVLGVSDEPTALVSRFVEEQRRRGQAFEQTIALEGGGVRRDYGVRSLPTLVVIDRSGRVRLVHVGAGDMAPVDALVASLLAESGG